LSGCGLTPQQRRNQIYAVLDTVSVPQDVRNQNTNQGRAAEWLIDDDGLQLCPDDEKLIQRWALAVIYFATNGEDWLQCSNNPLATDACGTVPPFIGDTRFLSANNECTWAGIVCDVELCVTEIEFGA
jgi:hypothetical protein